MHACTVLPKEVMATARQVIVIIHSYTSNTYMCIMVMTNTARAAYIRSIQSVTGTLNLKIFW